MRVHRSGDIMRKAGSTTLILQLVSAVLLFVLIVLGGLAYSFFPYLVLDEITLWDAAAPVATLRLALSAVVIALPVALIFNLWVYWRMLGRSRPPSPPDFRP